MLKMVSLGTSVGISQVFQKAQVLIVWSNISVSYQADSDKLRSSTKRFTEMVISRMKIYSGTFQEKPLLKVVLNGRWSLSHQ